MFNASTAACAILIAMLIIAFKAVEPWLRQRASGDWSSGFIRVSALI
jgi:hypothetical protein